MNNKSPLEGGINKFMVYNFAIFQSSESNRFNADRKAWHYDCCTMLFQNPNFHC